jgi:hypothetical protein
VSAKGESTVDEEKVGEMGVGGWYFGRLITILRGVTDALCWGAGSACLVAVVGTLVEGSTEFRDTFPFGLAEIFVLVFEIGESIFGNASSVTGAFSYCKTVSLRRFLFTCNFITRDKPSATVGFAVLCHWGRNGLVGFTACFFATFVVTIRINETSGEVEGVNLSCIFWGGVSWIGETSPVAELVSASRLRFREAGWLNTFNNSSFWMGVEGFKVVGVLAGLVLVVGEAHWLDVIFGGGVDDSFFDVEDCEEWLTVSSNSIGMAQVPLGF